jgi:hypothetical protein
LSQKFHIRLENFHVHSQSHGTHTTCTNWMWIQCNGQLLRCTHCVRDLTSQAEWRTTETTHGRCHFFGSCGVGHCGSLTRHQEIRRWKRTFPSWYNNTQKLFSFLFSETTLLPIFDPTSLYFFTSSRL